MADRDVAVDRDRLQRVAADRELTPVDRDVADGQIGPEVVVVLTVLGFVEETSGMTGISPVATPPWGRRC